MQTKLGRAAIRHAVQQYFSGQVDGLNTVYRSIPKDLPDGDFFDGQPGGTQSGAIACIALREAEEDLETFGVKRALYEVALALYMRSWHESAEKAMDDYDALVDAVKARVRQDSHFADEDAIDNVGDQITDTHEDPTTGVRMEGLTEMWGVVTFTVEQVWEV